MEKRLVPVGLSNKHCHLSQKDIDILFGKGYELTKFKDLSQPGQYACNEKIDVVGPKGKLTLRVLGPARSESQVEVSISDGFALGVVPPVMGSGSLDGTPGGKLVGPKGEVEIQCGIIAAARHIHMTPADAEKFNVKDKQLVKVRFEGPRGVVFENVLVRVRDDFALEFHADIEEGNAAGLKNGDMVEIIE